MGPLAAEQKVAGQLASVFERTDDDALLEPCGVVVFAIVDDEAALAAMCDAITQKLRALALPIASDAKRLTKERIQLQVCRVARTACALLARGDT